MKSVNFTGTAMVLTDYDKKDDSVDQHPVRTIARFETNGKWVVNKEDFKPIKDETVNGAVDSIEVSLVDAVGTSNSATKDLTLVARFTFVLRKGILRRTCNLKITLDTGSHDLLDVDGKTMTVHGGKLGAEHGFALAGVARFSSGPLSGHQCGIELRGKFDQSPW